MTRLLPHTAFVAGLLALAWVGAGYFPGSPLALALVLLIAAFYVAGALELRRFQHANSGLADVLAATDRPPEQLAAWLAGLPPALRPAVQHRVEGERIALPGPVLTPHLAGLLVLLGMLGTFLGMVVTLKGTGMALEQASDVEAIRASLAAPVKGLGLAFGCSVAGVAASAMLGLMSALLRRERQGLVRQLDVCIATHLRSFSRRHQEAQALAQRERGLQLLQTQADTLPLLVAQLQALVAKVERQGQTLQEGLLTAQTQFHGEARSAYTALAESVDRSLKTSLAESARLAGAAIEPAVQATMAGITRESATLQATIGGAVQQQLDGMGARLDATAATLAAAGRSTLERFANSFEERSRTLVKDLATQSRTAAQSTADGFGKLAAELLRSVAEAHAAADAAAVSREQQRQAVMAAGLTALAGTLRSEQQQVTVALERSASAVVAQAELQARATLAEIERLVQAASEAPRAAAQVIGDLRQALSDSLVRDNVALVERNSLLATLGSLLDAVNRAAHEQRGAIDALVRGTAELLDRVGARFAETVGDEAAALHTVAAQVSGSAAELASLGEGFSTGVQLFGRASEQLTVQLQRIETALGQSLARSDEQLAYYVAQAREIVDLTLGSQKQIVDDLQQLAAKGPAAMPRTEPADA